MATIRDKAESNSEQTGGRIGPLAGRAPTRAPEAGSPGAMEDEERAKGRQ